MHTVYIEYCTSCGFYQKFGEIKQVIETAFPGVIVKGNVKPPRMSTFEISLDNGTLVYSKLQTKSLPSSEVVIKKMQEALKAEKEQAGAPNSGHNPSSFSRHASLAAASVALVAAVVGLYAFAKRRPLMW